ncbi:hypothetical protein BC830DRAFT_598675 [Chytriomyces sp. MP71]|nr:hypothetical protein BC830DRAFT_598675 [Chytriomyces sp. MP71]
MSLLSQISSDCLLPHSRRNQAGGAAACLQPSLFVDYINSDGADVAMEPFPTYLSVEILQFLVQIRRRAQGAKLHPRGPPSYLYSFPTPHQQAPSAATISRRPPVMRLSRRPNSGSDSNDSIPALLSSSEDDSNVSPSKRPLLHRLTLFTLTTQAAPRRRRRDYNATGIGDDCEIHPPLMDSSEDDTAISLGTLPHVVAQWH